MVAIDTITSLIETHGLLVLAPVSILEGPIITVIAAYLAKLGYMNLYAVYVIVVMGDLIGDALFYGFGHGGLRLVPQRWQKRLGLNETRLTSLVENFNRRGGRILVMGKLTHSVGAAILVAAGMAKMPFWKFLWYNLLATLPKSLFFMVIGYTLGYATSAVDSYIFRVSAVMLVLILMAGGIWFIRHKKGSWM